VKVASSRLCKNAEDAGFPLQVGHLTAPAARPDNGRRMAVESKLESYKPYLRERSMVGVWNGEVHFRELPERGYLDACEMLTDWLRPQRKEAESLAVRRFETPVGKQAQVDWGHLGSRSEDDRERKLWGFSMTLGYSR